MNVTIPMKDHKIIVEKARRDAYHEGYKQGRFDEFIESQYGREDHDIIPVIRCKDCIHRYSTCPMITIHPTGSITFRAQDDWFCFMGERKEDGETN